MAEAVGEVVPTAAVEYLKKFPGDDMFHDTLDYLAKAYRRAGDHFGDRERARLVEAVIRRFGYFRCYHGCRALSLEGYFLHGLQRLTRDRLAEIAFTLFEGTVSREEIAGLAKAANLKIRLGHVYFTADKQELVSQCGHYLIYGAEALCCLWRDKDGRALPRFLESQERHRTRGTPTIFECDVPMGWIPTSYRTELANTIVTQYFQLQSVKPIPAAQWNRNWGYSIRRDLPARYFRGHSHPEVIRDPLRHGINFLNPQRSCAWCAPTIAGSQTIAVPSSANAPVEGVR